MCVFMFVCECASVCRVIFLMNSKPRRLISVLFHLLKHPIKKRSNPHHGSHLAHLQSSSVKEQGPLRVALDLAFVRA